MDSIAVASPAKINLLLAVTGRRHDGFHDLVSLVAPLQFGDALTLQRTGAADAIELICTDPSVPPGRDNLAVRAAEAFQAATGRRAGIRIQLTKRIPIGAGLGGGSSNAAAVLRALNLMEGEPLSAAELSAVAAKLGSDCPLFLAGGPCVIRGRGELIAPLPAAARRRLSGTRLLVGKPDFAIATPWAYSRLAATPGAYADAAVADERLAAWLRGDRATPTLLFNSFQPIVCRKFMVLPHLLHELTQAPGVEGALLSGSGSACFALLSAQADAARLTKRVREILGASAFVSETALA